MVAGGSARCAAGSGPLRRQRPRRRSECRPRRPLWRPSHRLRAKGLTKHFGKLEAVRDLALEVGAGEVLWFLGPNGAGKTTTIRMLTGLVRPTSGTALVAGYDVAREPQEVKRRVGFLAETPYLYAKLR